jgi:hypothetical protein
MSVPSPSVVFFDCDDCLYKNDWKVANMLTTKIEQFCSTRMKDVMKEGYAYELYKKYGTCLRGMVRVGTGWHFTTFAFGSKHQLMMTASMVQMTASMVHVTNLTPQGVATVWSM